MPRLLIADDNSNVQKSVSLALKDTGIEVVAVGNGGAAVRKMAEISPDLVLTDIFMPVHNGYEVCDFVKDHPQYMHTPVVLLIGAFDPLDEREAERVRADGVLTKPFMPPDSLISMVTGLLVKSAEERLVAVPVRVSGEAEAGKEVKPEPEASVPEFADPPAEEFALPSGSISFAGDEKPLAFGSLLESPPAPADEAEPVVSSASDPVLEEPVFWSEPPATEAAAETEETEETKETDDMVAEVDEFSLDSAATHTDTEPTDMQPDEWPRCRLPMDRQRLNPPRRTYRLRITCYLLQMRSNQAKVRQRTKTNRCLTRQNSNCLSPMQRPRPNPLLSASRSRRWNRHFLRSKR